MWTVDGAESSIDDPMYPEYREGLSAKTLRKPQSKKVNGSPKTGGNSDRAIA